METVGTRLKELRNSTGLSQAAFAKIAKTSQSAVNRYEQNQSAVPFRLLIWYADHFDVSLDYIFCRTENPHGKYYECEAKKIKERFQNKQEWNEFIEACFTDGSPMNMRFKEMLINMGVGEEK